MLFFLQPWIRWPQLRRFLAALASPLCAGAGAVGLANVVSAWLGYLELLHLYPELRIIMIIYVVILFNFDTIDE